MTQMNQSRSIWNNNQEVKILIHQDFVYLRVTNSDHTTITDDQQ